MNVLFYSRHCRTSGVVLRILHNEGILNNFKLCCVDDNLDKVPPQITKVPTLIVKGIPKPLVADEIIRWLESIKFVKKPTPQETPMPPQTTDTSKKMILGYVESEMNGFSDNFAFKDVDIALPHKYVGIGEDDKHPIFTAPENPQKMTALEQNKIIKDIEGKRTKQDEEYKNIMKEQQLFKIANDGVRL